MIIISHKRAKVGLSFAILISQKTKKKINWASQHKYLAIAFNNSSNFENQIEFGDLKKEYLIPM